VLLTTQYLDEADQLADEIVVIDHGRVVAGGTPAELKSRAGAQRLQVRPVDEADVEAVARIIAEVTGEVPAAAGGLLTAVVQDPTMLAAMVRHLDDWSIRVSELALRLPSLDEVFLTLTGHPAQEPGPDTTQEPVAEGALR